MTEKKKTNLIKELYTNRGLIWKLAKNDFKKRYAGSYLGAVWAMIQPVVTIAMYYVVFDLIMGAGAQAGPRATSIPYVLFLTAGLVPWFFFSEALTHGTSAMVEYNYLVKKVVFNVSILPVIKVVAAIFIHAFFVCVMLVMAAIYGYYPSLYTIQVVYYSFCTLMLVLGLSYITSAVMVFFRDIAQIIGIALQLGMWATPILWNIDNISPTWQLILSINPLVYIVSGYRDAVVSGAWFWENPWGTLYFWGFTIVFLWLGTTLFGRLKPHFADVL
ncbi:MAG: ABC transporter permease [Lachnospiraceae bacterium]|nr:ABC transporter permease [Candidatus Colinaster scatohippi]